MTKSEQALFNGFYINGLQLAHSMEEELEANQQTLKFRCLLWLVKCMSDQYMSDQDIVLAYEMVPDWDGELDGSNPWHDCEFIWGLESMTEELRKNEIDTNPAIRTALTTFIQHLKVVEDFSNSVWRMTSN